MLPVLPSSRALTFSPCLLNSLPTVSTFHRSKLSRRTSYLINHTAIEVNVSILLPKYVVFWVTVLMIEILGNLGWI